MDPVKSDALIRNAQSGPHVLDMPRPYVGYPEPQPATQGSSLGDYWRILQKRKWTVILTAAFVLVVVTIATFRMTPLYEATARIAISKEDNDNIRVGDQSAMPDYSFDYNIELDTQAKILQSDTLATQVIEQLQLDKNPGFAPVRSAPPTSAVGSATGDSKREAQLLDAWRNGLQVNKIQRTRMIEIRFLSPEPKLAAQIVNALSSAYVENNYRTRYESTMQASEWLSKQLNDLQIKVEQSQEALVRFERENGIVGLDEKQNTIIAKLNDLNREATAAQADRVQKEAILQMAKSGELDSLPELSANPLIQDFRKQEGDLKRELAQATVQFGPSYPKVIELKKQVDEVDSNLRAEVARIINRKESDYRAALNRERLLQSALASQKSEVSDLNQKAITYVNLKQDADSNRQLYDGLQAKLKEAAVTSGLKSSNVRIVDIARPAQKPAKPNIPRNISLGFLLGLLGGVALAFVMESLDNTIRTPDQVEIVAGLPSLGIIPLSLNVKSGAAAGANMSLTKAGGQGNEFSLVTHVRPKSEAAESYRALRTSILLSSIGSAPKVILMTSALPQEGKTTTSVNTGIVLAQRGGRILLVDADMRRPSLHHTFKMRNRVGLSTLLTGSSTMEETIQPSPILPNLFVIPSGPPPPHPAELLGSEVMKSFLQRWRSEFDHIILDSPPMLSVTDAVVLSVDADAVVLVIRSAQTTKEALRRSRELLAQVNAKVMGVVVNAIDLQSPDSYYYYYGANYGGRYYDESARRK